MESFPRNSCIQMQFSLPTPCFNVALNSKVRASTMWINIKNGDWGKSLVITPQWSNTFGPDCLSEMQNKSSNFSLFCCKIKTKRDINTKLPKYNV